METIGNMFSALWEVWMEMLDVLMEILPKAMSFIFWVLAGIIVFPCALFINHVYPKWVEWGEKF